MRLSHIEFHKSNSNSNQMKNKNKNKKFVLEIALTIPFYNNVRARIHYVYKSYFSYRRILPVNPLQKNPSGE